LSQSVITKIFPDGLPVPFEAVLARLKTKIHPRSIVLAQNGGEEIPAPEPIAVLIPESRSLHQDAIDAQFPRIVVAMDAEPNYGSDENNPNNFDPNADLLGVSFQNRLFVAYSEKPKTVEIISYNEGSGKFDFLTVEDYGAEPKNPRFANRDLCITCHQGGGPIFSSYPWNNTNQNFVNAENNKTVARDMIIAARGPSPYHGVDPNAFYGYSNIAGQRIDASVAAGNSALRFNFLWQNLCVGDQMLACRGVLLRVALGDPYINQEYADLIKANWERLSTIKFPMFNAHVSTSSPGTVLPGTEAYDFMDPKRLRVFDAIGKPFNEAVFVRNFKEFGKDVVFSRKDGALLERAAHGRGKTIGDAVWAFVQASHNWPESPLRAAVPRRAEIIRGIFAAMSYQVSEPFLAATLDAAPEDDRDHRPVFANASVFQILQSRCASCHGADPMPFMKNLNEAGVESRLKPYKERLLKVLAFSSATPMPPISLDSLSQDEQRFLMQDRAALEAYAKSL
jgi:mono/diheme cytochrome c family protein